MTKLRTKLPTKSEIIRPILESFKEELIKIYPEKLLALILFGSYARGDFRADSDVDLLLLFDEKFTDFTQKDLIFDLINDFLLEKNIIIMPIGTPKSLFDTKKIPLYLNVKKEGILLWKK